MSILLPCISGGKSRFVYVSAVIHFPCFNDMFRKGHLSVRKLEATLCRLDIKGSNTGNRWFTQKKGLRERWSDKSQLTFSTWSAQNSPWSFSEYHIRSPFWLKQTENNGLSIALTQGCPLSTCSSLEPYAQGDSSKCRSCLLLFRAKETLEGVVTRPSQQRVIQHVCQISGAGGKGSWRASDKGLFADKLKKTKTHSKNSLSSFSTGFFSHVTLGTKDSILWSWEEPVEMQADSICVKLVQSEFLLCENKCYYLSHVQLFFVC